MIKSLNDEIGDLYVLGQRLDRYSPCRVPPFHQHGTKGKEAKEGGNERDAGKRWCLTE